MYYLNRAIPQGKLVLLLLLLLSTPGLAEEKPTEKQELETAKVQANIGADNWQKGNLSQAIAAWQKEAEIYHLQGLSEREAEARIKISQGYINLGQFRLAIIELEKNLFLNKEPLILARTWKQLGNAYTRSGEFDKATLAYQKSLKIEPNLSTLNNLVILLQKQKFQAKLQAESSRKGQETQRYLAEAESYQTEAVKYAQEALSLSQTEQSSSAVRALIEWGKVSSTGLSTQQLERGRKLLGSLASSRTQVFLTLNWAKLDYVQTKYWLSQAQEIAKNLGDARAESFALLELGLLAEKSGEYEQALKYAYAAQLKAQSRFAFSSLYRAQWLTGRIYQKIGNKEAAITNYREAIAALDAFNQGFTEIDIERRLDFQSQIEPLYREMLKLLLEESNLSQANLEETIFVVDKLRLAQLQQYFGDNCLSISRESLPIEDVLTDKNAVLINSIILDDRTHFVLQLPDGTLRHSQAEVGEAEITKIANEWYNHLKNADTQRFRTKAQDLYGLIIRPFEAELEQINPSTLIFVHDGLLRNLPMAALHDGEKFLAQKWASVSSLGLNFQSTASSEKKLEALAFGLGVAREGWSELAYVESEINKLATLIGGHKFLNEDFTRDKLAQSLKDERHSLVHLATHGYFGGIAENSFVLAYDQPLSALDLEDYLSQSKEQIELLVLSACETAISSDRSALGLAGVALRGGVSSVLGNFWQVKDDEQVELMNAFYSNLLVTNFDQAQAVQRVQIAQIEQKAPPAKWAALNLIEN